MGPFFRDWLQGPDGCFFADLESQISKKIWTSNLESRIPSPTIPRRAGIGRQSHGEAVHRGRGQVRDELCSIGNALSLMVEAVTTARLVDQHWRRREMMNVTKRPALVAFDWPVESA